MQRGNQPLKKTFAVDRKYWDTFTTVPLSFDRKSGRLMHLKKTFAVDRKYRDTFTALPHSFDWKYGRLVAIYIWMLAIDCKCLLCQFMASLTTNSSSRKVNLLGQASIFLLSPTGTLYVMMRQSVA